DLPFLHTRIDAGHNTLLAKTRGCFADQLGSFHRGGIDADFVGACAQYQRDVGNFIDAAADGQWDEQFFSGTADNFEQRAPPFGRSGDVEENNLVGAFRLVTLRQLDGIAHVAQILEAGAFDDASILHIQADDYSFA